MPPEFNPILTEWRSSRGSQHGRAMTTQSKGSLWRYLCEHSRLQAYATMSLFRLTLLEVDLAGRR